MNVCVHGLWLTLFCLSQTFSAEKPNSPLNVTPAWSIGDSWTIGIYLSNTLRPTPDISSTNPPAKGFRKVATFKFEVIETSDDVTLIDIEIPNFSKEKHITRLRFRRGKKSTVQEIKLNIETNVSEKSAEKEIDEGILSRSSLVVPNIDELRSMESKLKKDGVFLNSIEIADENTRMAWERGRPWWTRQTTRDDDRVAVKAVLLSFKYHGDSESIAVDEQRELQE